MPRIAKCATCECPAFAAAKPDSNTTLKMGLRSLSISLPFKNLQAHLSVPHQEVYPNRDFLLTTALFNRKGVEEDARNNLSKSR